ncbi:MAG: efflux RND transporter permease subunit [Desulfobacter sp.]|nr:MAG: efflux RND transporter permease subunit [Desulfobacter sp.]
MKTLSRWFTRNPVAANLLALLVILGGLFTLWGIRIEGFPKIPPTTLSIDVAYPDAGAGQVDDGISRKIEKSLEGLAGIKKITSIAHEGACRILVQKETGYDMIRLLNDVKSRVDGIGNLPARAERPIVSVDEFQDFALLVQIYGDVDEKTLQQAARLVELELKARPEISRITAFGKKERELRLELDSEKLKAFSLSVSDVAEAVSRNRSQIGFGRLKNDGQKIIIRSDARLEYHDQLMALPLITAPDGALVFIRDVAKIVDGYADVDSSAFFQGRPSVGLVINTSARGDLIQVSRAARQAVEALSGQLPEAVKTDIWADISVYMKNRLHLLQTNAWQGLLIVFVILALFLNTRLAFWVAMGIPFSIAGALALMGRSFLDYSLNDITTFGMIIVLGILVDDAVVVGESVFESRQHTRDPIKGTVEGVHRVALATIFGCLTTIAAFFPLMLTKNDLGRILASFAVVVCVALLFSLIESKLVLPAHLASVSMGEKPGSNPFSRACNRIRSTAARGLDFFNRRIYAPVLRASLSHRYTVLVVFIFLALAGGWLIRMGHIRTVFFPDIPGDVITVSGTMERGMPAELALKNARIIEGAARDLNGELSQVHIREPGARSAALPPIRNIMTAVDGNYAFDIYAELQPQDKRKVETMDLLRMWRQRTRGLEGLQSLKFSGNAETGGGFILKVSSRDTANLADGVNAVKAGLEKISGVSDIRDDLASGETEIRLRLKDEARHLGLTPEDLSAQIGAAFGGFQIDRFQKGEDEVKLKVIMGRGQRRYISHLLDARIRLGDGSLVPLPMVADFKFRKAASYIQRENGRRTALVMAALDKSQVSAGEVFDSLESEVIPGIEASLPGLTVSRGGELEEEGEMKGGLVKALVMILILIYALLAVPLKSYWKPFVIMSVIPFGFTGAAAGHFISGVPLSLLSFFGMLALAGIVVNDSLVMLTRFNELLDQGNSVKKALHTAGTSRFRAIFLTTATTVCGLMPLLSETSEQAQYLIPAAVSLAYGELFATLITLILIPILMAIAYDIRGLLAPSRLIRPA